MDSAKPTPLPVSPGAIPTELKELPQWVCWRYVYQPVRNAKKPWAKVPINPHTGHEAKSNDSKTWSTFEHVMHQYQQGGVDGIGLVLTAHDPYAGIDLDGCRLPETGEIAPWGQAIVDRLASYTEVSPSETGLRIFLRGKLPLNGRRKGAIEMYDRARFLTVTGCHLENTPSTIEDRACELKAFHAEVFGARNAHANGEAQSPPNDNESSAGLSDEAILERAMRAANADKFMQLWAGDTSGYPSASESDLALCCLLAFWTRDPTQIDRLFRRSKLYRPKWQDQHGTETYGAMTIRTALETVTTQCTPNGDSHGESEAIHLTDWGNAQRLIRRFGQDVHYVHPWKKWLHWNGCRWEMDEIGAVEALAKRVIAGLFQWASSQVEAIRDTLKGETDDEE